MIGIDQHTGKTLSGLDHIRQSLGRLFSTPIGSRVMVREYGCDLFDKIDQPANESNTLKLLAAITDAILRWEDRILPTRVYIDSNNSAQGEFGIYLEAVVVKGIDNIPAGANVNLSIPIVGTA